jgi:hypothetical protein
MVATARLPPVNSTRQRASILQVARRCCVVLKTHVAIVCFKCFGCFRDMLQFFNVNIAKVDHNVYICCNGCTSTL